MRRLTIMGGRRERAPLRSSKAGLVYDSLKTAIVTGELQPGDPIDKLALAEKFGASRQPISIAIDRLALDGLVDVIPQHGSFVSKLRAKPVSERFLIRRAIEAELVAMAAASVTDELIRRLDLNLRYQQVALDAGDRVGFLQQDYEFHRIICDHSPVEEAMRILDRLEAYLGRIRFLLMPGSERPAQTIVEHRAIRDAIASGDPAKASEAMRSHIDAVENHFREFVVARPDLFDNA
ncbi:MAG TPA: GntR family transcriptional regulator [Hyphomicrobiales bacterium]|jgi:DNA-binding GntR family transcriptional regulator